MNIKILIAFSFLLIGINLNAQMNKLFGSYWTGSEEIFSSVDLSTKVYTDIDTLTDVLYLAQGETTFDFDNERYFNKTNLGITIIDIATGAILDTITNSIGLKGIEYDRVSEKLYGSYWTGSEEIFACIDLTSKTYTDIDTLTNVLYLVQGETTFDFDNGRYFNKTNLGITIIDIATGAILDTITNSIGLKGIEYDRVSEKLYGSYWTGSDEILASLDLTTKTYTNIGTLTDVMSLAQGEATFDFENGRYFNKTNLGITIINITTGAILDTITNTIGMKGIEFPNRLKKAGITENISGSKFHLYPNPTKGDITIEFETPQKSIQVNIISFSGQLIQSNIESHVQNIQIEINESPGIYLLEIIDENGLKKVVRVSKN